MVSEGLITRKDLEEARSGEGNRVISIGLPAYCLVQGLLRSAKSNAMGIFIGKWNPSSSSCYFPLAPFFLFFFLFNLLRLLHFSLPFSLFEIFFFKPFWLLAQCR